MEARALDLYIESRAEHFASGRLKHARQSKILEPSPDGLSFMYDTSDNAGFLMEKLIGKPYPDDKHKFPRQDEEYMTAFLQENKRDELPNVPALDILGAIPDRVPLIRSLQVDMQSRQGNASYQYPTVHCLDQILDNSSIDQFSSPKILEIDLIRSSHEERVEFVKIVQSFQAMNELEFPSGILSVDTESIMINEDDLYTLRKEHKKMLNGDASAKTVFKSRISGKQKGILARIIFGDGITWSACIKFPWMKGKGDKDIVFHIGTLDAFDPLVSFLRNQAAWVGHGVIDDRNDVMDLLLDLYGISENFPPALEIEALLTLAGSKYPRSNMVTNHLLIAGTLLNKVVSRADNKWHYEDNDLDESLKLYLIGDIKSGYICALVLLSILLREIFPDPDVMCFALSLSQANWVKYFCSLIIRIGAEKEIDTDLRKVADTRKDVILTLRGYDNYSNARYKQKTPDPVLHLFAKLIPPWPTIPYGGARCLHTVRLWFLQQYQVLVEIKHIHPRINANLRRMDMPIAEYDIFEKQVTFDRRFNTAGLINLPVTSVNAPGLTCAFKFINTLWSGKPEDLRFSSLKAQAKANGREIGPALEEICRLEPDILAKIFITLRTAAITESVDRPADPDYVYWRTKPRVYQRLSQMYENLYCRQPINVPQLDRIIEDRIANTEADALYSMPSRQHELRAEYIKFLAGKSTSAVDSTIGIQHLAHAAQPALNHQQRRKIDRQLGISRKSRGEFKARSTSSNSHGEIRKRRKSRPKKTYNQEVEPNRKVYARKSNKQVKFDLRDKLNNKYAATKRAQPDTGMEKDETNNDDMDIDEPEPRREQSPTVYFNSLSLDDKDQRDEGTHGSEPDIGPLGDLNDHRPGLNAIRHSRREAFLAKFRAASYDPKSSVFMEFDPPNSNFVDRKAVSYLDKKTGRKKPRRPKGSGYNAGPYEDDATSWTYIE